VFNKEPLHRFLGDIMQTEGKAFVLRPPHFTIDFGHMLYFLID
jgi:hypothetical protein